MSDPSWLLDLFRLHGLASVLIADTSAATVVSDLDSRAFVIVALGTVTAPRTMVLPHRVGAMWLVPNTTANDLNVRGPNGGAAVVPANTNRLIFSDGTNFALVVLADTSSAVADASPTVKGIVKLTGDLGGTALAPILAKLGGLDVTGLAGATADQVPVVGVGGGWVPGDVGSLVPAASSGARGAVKIAGDLGGMADAPTVASVGGMSAAAVAAGAGAGAMALQAVPAATSSVRGGIKSGGDLTIVSDLATIAKVNGHTLSGSPTDYVGGDGACRAVPSSGGWATLYDLDLTALSSSMLSDGTVTIDGKAWTLSGAAHGAPAFVHGTGLVWTPAADGGNCNLTIALSALAALASHRVRVLARLAFSGTAGGADAVALLGLDVTGRQGSSFAATSTPTQVIGFWARPVPGLYIASTNATQGFASTSATGATDDVMALVWDGPYNAQFSGAYGTDWPNGADLRQRNFGMSSPLQTDSMIGSASIGFNLYRAGGANAFTATLTRLTVQTSL